jgi:hypothetical protein
VLLVCAPGVISWSTGSAVMNDRHGALWASALVGANLLCLLHSVNVWTRLWHVSGTCANFVGNLERGCAGTCLGAACAQLALLAWLCPTGASEKAVAPHSGLKGQ